VESVEVQGNRAAATFSWTDGDGSRQERAQALIFQDGRIVHMQDLADPDKARRALRR
jgi:hypothetical protein